MRENFIAVDIHSHINHGSPYDSAALKPEESSAFPEHIEAIARAAGIDKSFVSTFASVTRSESITEENEFLRNFVKNSDFFYQWVVIDPRVEATLEQAAEMLADKKCVGIKLHPALHGYHFDDKKLYDTVASFASEYEATLLIHGGGDSNLAKMATEFPKINVILPHVATVGDVECAIDGNKHGNMWLDTSGIGSSRNNIIEYAVRKVGSERILFGTDTYAAGFQRGRIEYALISDADKENILCANAKRLFQKVFV